MLDRNNVTLGNYVPICSMTIVTLILIEAAGNADEVKKLANMDQKQVFSAKVSQV